MAKKDEKEQEEHPAFKDIPLALKKLTIENPTFVFISIALSIQFFVISASTAFNPKISLFQFRLTAAQASVFFALSAGTGCFLGNLAGENLDLLHGLFIRDVTLLEIC